ncbi:MAG: hypothetical protein JNJ82_16255 [Opitutaceae bacterium]|jgi:hypothetical protein|nr:hypothetical protein [Opitutaceae bacterium]
MTKRSNPEGKILAFPAGAFSGACVSPLAWWAFQVPDWRAGLAVTAVFALGFGIVSVVVCPKAAVQILTFVLRLLNP